MNYVTFLFYEFARENEVFRKYCYLICFDLFDKEIAGTEPI